METETKKQVIESWVADARQIQAAVAAEEARKEGADEDAVLAAAAEAYANFKATGNLSDLREYFIAVCQLAHGDFDKMSNEQLADVASLVRVPIHTADVWAE